ncbi:MAG: zinc ribbon domain-containing protein [bacterium]
MNGLLMSDVQFCKKCGKPFEPGEEFCTGCGEPMERVRKKIRIGDKSVSSALSASEPVKFDIRLKCGIIGFLCGFTVLFAVFSFFFFNVLHPAAAGFAGAVLFSIAFYSISISLQKRDSKFLSSLDRMLPLLPPSGPIRKIIDYLYSHAAARKRAKKLS